MKGARLLGESEPAANLMNDLIDGYRDGGCYGREAGGGGGLVVAIKKNKKHIVQNSISLVEMRSTKKTTLLAVAVQDWQKVLRIEANTCRLGVVGRVSDAHPPPPLLLLSSTHVLPSSS